MFQERKCHCKGQAGRYRVACRRDLKSSERGVGGGEDRAYNITLSKDFCALLVCVNFIYSNVTEVF